MRELHRRDVAVPAAVLAALWAVVRVRSTRAGEYEEQGWHNDVAGNWCFSDDPLVDANVAGELGTPGADNGFACS